MNQFNLMSDQEKLKYLQAQRLTEAEAWQYFGNIEGRLKPEIIQHIQQKKAKLNNQN